MPNARIATDIVGLSVTPGCARELTVNVQQDSGVAFNLTGYSVKAKVEIGAVDETITGNITNAAGGLSTVTLTAASTVLWPEATRGTITIYLDPASGSENIHVSTVQFRTNAEAVP